jgi:hypothetical protein
MERNGPQSVVFAIWQYFALLLEPGRPEVAYTNVRWPPLHRDHRQRGRRERRTEAEAKGKGKGKD